MIKGEGRGGGLRVADEGGFLWLVVLDDVVDRLRDTEAISIRRMDCNLPGLSPVGGLADDECLFVVGAVALLLIDEIVLRLEEEGKIEVDFDEEIGEGEVKRFKKDWRRGDEAFDAKLDEVEQVDDAIYSSLGMTKMIKKDE